MTEWMLLPGSTGDEVVYVQDQLRQLGFYEGAIDGDFGPLTEVAVYAFRMWRDLGPGSYVDEAMWSLLSGAVDWSAQPPQQDQQPDQRGPDGHGGGDGRDDEQEYDRAGLAAAYDENSVADLRGTIVRIVQEEVGKVRSGNPGDRDETGRYLRVGWSRLLRYFQEGAPDMAPDETVKYYDVGGLPPWSGVFAIWALRSAGVTGVSAWRQGAKVPDIAGLTLAYAPTAGDVAYLDKSNQVGIVIEVSGEQVTTVEADNSGDGQIREQTRAEFEFAGFYSPFS